MSRAAAWIVGALLAAGVVLVAVELGKGALDEPSPKIANPCSPRHGRTGGFDTTVQRIVLDGLDGAACRLHTTREELVLSLGGGTVIRRRWDEQTVEAEDRGDIPSFLAPLVRRLVERAPLDRIIEGGFSLSGLLG